MEDCSKKALAKNAVVPICSNVLENLKKTFWNEEYCNSLVDVLQNQKSTVSF